MQLPSGWKKVKLGEVAKVTSGGTPLRTKIEYWNGNIPWVKTAQIQNGHIGLNQVDEYITELGVSESSAKIVPAGTLLMAMYGQGKTRGQVAILDFSASINQACAAFNLNETQIVRDFLFQYFLFCYEDLRAVSNSGGQQNLSADLIKKFPVILPPLAEQKKIAETLSVWDSAIEKMEKLIECKEKIHAKLLNDCIHCADWKISSIESVATVKKGIQLNGENMISNGSYYVMNGGVVPSGYTDEWNTPENTVSISEGGNSCGFVAFNDEKFWAGSHCYTLIDVSPEVLPKFLFHYLKNKEKEIMKLRVGSGLPNIQKDSITNFEFKYPTKKEQKNIVEILDSSQKELSLLKQQLALYKKQKQGLMQKLLTGEWRVK